MQAENENNNQVKKNRRALNFLVRHKFWVLVIAALLIIGVALFAILSAQAMWANINTQEQMDIVLDGYNGEGEFSLVYGVADELDKTAMKRFKQLNYAMFEEYYLYGYMNYTYISDMDRNDQQDFYRIYNVAKYMTIQVYQVTDEGDIELIPDADDIYGGDLKNGDVIKIVGECPKQYLDAARVRINVSEGTYVVSGLKEK